MSRRGRRSPSSRSAAASPPPPTALVSDESNSSVSPRLRYLTVAAVVVGAVCWALAGNDLPLLQWAVVLPLVGVCLIPKVTRVLASLLDRLRRPSPRAV